MAGHGSARRGMAGVVSENGLRVRQGSVGLGGPRQKVRSERCPRFSSAKRAAQTSASTCRCCWRLASGLLPIPAAEIVAGARAVRAGLRQDSNHHHRHEVAVGSGDLHVLSPAGDWLSSAGYARAACAPSAALLHSGHGDFGELMTIETEHWCWCEECAAPSTMNQHGRCERCGSNAVAFLERLQLGEERGKHGDYREAREGCGQTEVSNSAA